MIDPFAADLWETRSSRLSSRGARRDVGTHRRTRADATPAGRVRGDPLQLPSEPKLGLTTAFDAIHDQVDPAGVLGNVRRALADDGLFFMVDFKFSSNLEDNLDNPVAALYYGISTMHCLTISLAEGGAGLGTVWGIQTARRMLADAGFSNIEVLDSPRPQNCIYLCRP
jgi:hypothetical protein